MSIGRAESDSPGPAIHIVLTFLFDAVRCTSARTAQLSQANPSRVSGRSQTRSGFPQSRVSRAGWGAYRGGKLLFVRVLRLRLACAAVLSEPFGPARIPLVQSTSSSGAPEDSLGGCTSRFGSAGDLLSDATSSRTSARTGRTIGTSMLGALGSVRFVAASGSSSAAGALAMATCCAGGTGDVLPSTTSRFGTPDQSLVASTGRTGEPERVG